MINFKNYNLNYFKEKDEYEDDEIISIIENMECDMHVKDERIEELEQCNLNLQEWIDNKEKVNKQLREELDKLKSTYVYDAKQVRDIC